MLRERRFKGGCVIVMERGYLIRTLRESDALMPVVSPP